MRDNGPVTGRDELLADRDILIARTDAGGPITVAGPSFVAIRAA